MRRTRLAMICLALPWLCLPWFFPRAGAEEPAVKCPIAKPKVIPEQLRTVFSPDPKVKLDARVRELNEADEGPANTDALRWLAHQPETGDELRIEIVRVLSFWRAGWLADDLGAMVEDPAQPLSFRRKCVDVLAGRHFRYDDTAAKLLERAAESSTLEIRDAAVSQFARVAYDCDWRKHEPARFVQVDKLLTRALAETRPEALVSVLQAVGATEWASKTARVEELAGDAKQPPEVRRAALEALCAVPGPATLAVLEPLLTSPDADLAAAAGNARCFALVRLLGDPQREVREKAFRDLAAASATARPALEKAVLGEESETRTWARALLGDLVLARLALPLIETRGLKRLYEDPKTGKAGLPELVLDKDRKLIVADGDFVLEQGALEFAVVSKGPNAKLHETVLALDVSPTNLTTALLACGIVFAGELRDKGKVNLPPGAGVMLSVQYEYTAAKPDGPVKKLVRLPIEAFIWNLDTKRYMRRAPWAFTGSQWIKSEDNKMMLLAELDKTVAAIRVDPGALLNTPLDSAEFADFGEGREPFYEVYRGLVPARGTRAQLIFEPWTGEKLTAEDLHDLGAQPRPKPPEHTGSPTSKPGE